MCLLIGKDAPDFCAPAVSKNGEIVSEFILSENIRDKYALLFFYPMDFTFVCPSELIAIDRRMSEFDKRNIDVIGISVDSQYAHNAWRNKKIEEGGIGPVKFTLVADVNHHICQAYGVEHPIEGVAFRGTFLIDKNSIVRSQIINDIPIGRSIKEILRLFDAIEFNEKFGDVCPADWQEGKKGITATPKGIVDYLTQYSEEL